MSIDPHPFACWYKTTQYNDNDETKRDTRFLERWFYSILAVNTKGSSITRQRCCAAAEEKEKKMTDVYTVHEILVQYLFEDFRYYYLARLL